MKIFIGLNIKYLCEKNFLSQDEFGERFGLKKSVVGTYIREVSQPKIETIQKICKEFNITIDDFINQPLEQVSNSKNDVNISTSQNADMIKLLQEALNDKQKIILSLEKEIRELKGIDDKSQAV
jgi:transcriptional regulator with XRE-family HTH domain